MKSMKADKRNPDLAKFTGSCDYGMEDIDFEGNLEPEIVNITVEFDRAVQGFKVLFSWHFLMLSRRLTKSACWIGLEPAIVSECVRLLTLSNTISLTPLGNLQLNFVWIIIGVGKRLH